VVGEAAAFFRLFHLFFQRREFVKKALRDCLEQDDE
jgi:hypothetical protein